MVSIVAVLALPAAAQVSQNVDFLANQHLYGTYSSCWGYTSPGGKELALLGVSNGTSVVDVTVPSAPVELAFFPGPTSTWRNMKTHDHYAYVVTEGTNGGMLIIDLATSPPTLVATYNATFTTAHTLNITDGYAYVNGARNGATQVGIRILNLANPTNPVDVGGWNGFYTHDCAVRGNRLYAACINNSLLAVVDITNRAAATTLTTFSWTGNKAHNCDITADGRYLFTTDEVTGGHIHVFDVQDLGNIRQVAEWTSDPAAIIHNVHLKGDRAYVAYYTEGARVLDIANPEYPVEMAYYDTWPGVVGGFNGNWEVYPYAASGNFYASDISTGLYVLRIANDRGSVSGTVTDAVTTLPIAGVTSTIVGGPSAVSSSAGFYKMYHDPGNVTVVTSAFGYFADSSATTISGGGNVQLDFALQPRPSGALDGVVRDAVTTNPLPGAAIALWNTPLEAASGPAGDYAFADVPLDVYSVRASRFGYASQTRTVSVTLHQPLESTVLNFDLQPAALAHDFEIGASGWSRVAPVNQASSGLWILADPVGSGGGAVQPEDDHSSAPGVQCWVTGNAASPTEGVGTADVDGGATILQSPLFDLTSIANPSISYWRWYSNDAGSNPGTDTLHVLISNNNGATWKVVEKLVQSQAAWTQVTFAVASLLTPTAQMRMRIIAEDLGGGSVVEAAWDDFMVLDEVPTAAIAPVRADVLHPNVPNPFNPSTRIRFEVAQSGRTSLQIYDVGGRRIRDIVSGSLAAGMHERIWDGRDGRGHAVASGVYVLRLETTQSEHSRRLLLVK